MRRRLASLLGRPAAAWGLLACAAGSVALACLGSDGALAFMKRPAMLAALAAGAALCALACLRSRRPCVWLFHLGFALVIGGWAYDALAHRLGRVPEDRMLWLAEPMDGVARAQVFPESVLHDVARWHDERRLRDPSWTPDRADFTNLLAQIAADNRQDGRLEGDLALALDDFSIETWPGTDAVKAYTSRISFSDGSPRATVAVNHPVRRAGWWIFQNAWTRALDADFLWDVVRDGPDARAPGRLPPAYRIPMYHFMMRAKPCAGSPRAYWSGYGEHYDNLVGMCRARYGKPPPQTRPWCLAGLLCVKDVGLPFAFAGGLMLVLGALGLAVARLRAPAARGGSGGRPPTASALTRLFFSCACTAYELRPCRRLATAARVLYALLFAGTLAMLVHRGLATGHAPMQNMYEFLMCTAALIPALTFVSRRLDGEDTLLVDAALTLLVLVPVAFTMDGSARKLMPALQSPFFVPHVGAYVLGYVLLVRAALGAGRRLAGAGFFLLTLGLVLGAVWGKVCWGHWWQFDPKEMWSAATWFVYAAYFHLRPGLSARAERAFLAAGAAMVVLTLTWINLSRIFTGMHSYA